MEASSRAQGIYYRCQPARSPLAHAAYERRSVPVTSHLHPSGFDTIMPKTLPV
jgi:hypothetical protein